MSIGDIVRGGAKSLKELNDAVVAFRATVESVNGRLTAAESRLQAERNRLDEQLKEVRDRNAKVEIEVRVSHEKLEGLQRAHDRLAAKLDTLMGDVHTVRAHMDAGSRSQAVIRVTDIAHVALPDSRTPAIQLEGQK